MHPQPFITQPQNKNTQYIYTWIPNRPQTFVMLKQKPAFFSSSSLSSQQQQQSSSFCSSTYVIWITTNPSSKSISNKISNYGIKIEIVCYQSLNQAISGLIFQKESISKNNVKIQFWCDDFNVMKQIDMQESVLKEFGVRKVWFYQLNQQNYNGNQEQFMKLKPNLKLSSLIQYNYGKLQKIMSQNKKMFNFVFLNDADQTNLMLYSLYAMVSQQTNRQQIINHFCQLCLKNIPKSKKQIQIFRNQYKDVNYNPLGQQILIWYQNQTFFYQTLNPILRSCKDPTQLFCVQPFVSDLYNFIKNHQNQKNNIKNSSSDVDQCFSCYRGGFLNEDQISTMKNRINQIIQSLGFMSASTDIDRAKKFIVNCFYQIKVSNKNMLKQYGPGYLHWQNFQILEKQQQILFNILSSFTIQSITQTTIQSKNVYIITLKYGSIQNLMYNFTHQQSKTTKQQKCLANIRKFHNQYARYSMNQGTAIQKIIYCNSKIAWKYSVKQQQILNDFYQKSVGYQQRNLKQKIKEINLRINNFYRMFKIKWAVLQGQQSIIITQKCRKFYKKNKKYILGLFNEKVYEKQFSKFVSQLIISDQCQQQNKGQLDKFIINILPHLNQQQTFQNYIKNIFEKQDYIKNHQIKHYQRNISHINIKNNNFKANNCKNILQHKIKYQQIIDFNLIIQKYTKMLASICQYYKNYCNMQKVSQFKQQLVQITTFSHKIKPIQLYKCYFYQKVKQIMNYYYLQKISKQAENSNKYLTIQLITYYLSKITKKQQQNDTNSSSPSTHINVNQNLKLILSMLNNDYLSVQTWINHNISQIQQKINQGELKTQIIQSKIFTILVRSQYNDNTFEQINCLENQALKLTDIIDRYYGFNCQTKFLCIGMLNSIYYRKQKLIQIIELGVKQCQHNIFSFNQMQKEQEQKCKNANQRDFYMKIKYVVSKFKSNNIKDGLSLYEQCYNLPIAVKNQYRVKQIYIALSLLACCQVINYCSTIDSSNLISNNINKGIAQYKYIYQQCFNLQIIKHSCQKALIFIKTLIAYVCLDHTFNYKNNYPFIKKSILYLEQMLTFMKTASILNHDVQYFQQEECNQAIQKKRNYLEKYVCYKINRKYKNNNRNFQHSEKLHNKQKLRYMNNLYQYIYFIELAQIIYNGTKPMRQIFLLKFTIKLLKIKVKTYLDFPQNKQVIQMIKIWLKQVDNILFLLDNTNNNNDEQKKINCQIFEIRFFKNQRSKLIDLLENFTRFNLNRELSRVQYLSF